ncbi:class I SAM-dependent methyltransferase [Thermodesulfobacteriota bacterium]
MKPEDVISESLELGDGIWLTQEEGYWSNIKQKEMVKALQSLPDYSARQFIKRFFPAREEVIFGTKRPGGLGLLKFNKDDIVLDAGCMWGALTVPLGRSGCRVFGMDQTRESLLFLHKRLEEEGLTNVSLIRANLNKVKLKPNCFDKIIVNGVLEWLAEEKVEVDEYYKKRENKKSPAVRKNNTPRQVQADFLSKIFMALKPGGTLYLAIENRYDAANFFGYGDPHTGQRFVTLLPRFLQNSFSRIFTGRPYKTWIYSEKELRKLFTGSGFVNPDIYYAFPDYRMPELILSRQGMQNFRPVRYLETRNFRNKLFWYCLENIFYKYLKLASLAPSFIVTATKELQ